MSRRWRFGGRAGASHARRRRRGPVDARTWPRAGLTVPRRARREPTGMDSKTRRRTERLDVLLLGLALPRRHGRARVVLDHGAEVTCGRFRVSRTSRGWLGVPAAVLQRAPGFGCVCMPGASVRVFFQVHIGSQYVHFETCASARVRSDYFARGRFSCTKLCSNFLRDGGERCRA